MGKTLTQIRALSGAAIVALCLGIQPAKAAAEDRVLQVGIVQRYGDKTKDVMTLKTTPGDRMTLRFITNGKSQSLTTPELKLETVLQPLAQPQVEERVVFSTHRSFETAEHQAQQWRAQGIEVELAQPDRWQVWAKRETYNTPLLRRLLLQSLQAKGVQTVRIESKTVRQAPRPSFVVNGFRYTRDHVDITSGNGVIRIDREKDEQPSRVYAGSFRLQPNAYGNYTLVNFVPLETYLRGVVPHEIGGWAPQPVLEAQAILARTYVLRNLRRFMVDNYQICATTQCQVYWGIDGAVPSTDRAIAATRSLVLTYENELVDALYSSTTGGVTAAFTDVWRGWERPYLRSFVDSTQNVWDLNRRSLADENNLRAFIATRKGFNEEGAEMFRWRYANTLNQMNQDLRKYLKSVQHPLSDFGTIQQVQVVQRSTAGRVVKLRVTTDRGPLELEKDDVLNAFYAPASTLFYLDPIYEKNKALKGYAFVGGGLGHAVGLSQVGSYHLGKLGWTSDRILGFYFPGTQLQPINQSITLWHDRSIAQSQP
ncbi:MAG: SpoIID/LytB domain-containing protein [Leptolyngbyaceae cyanobacterium CSU_1_3]|nr:SpoIID/LytB domain-containing protein [Leptolyngbyaceae cyanobacterium CSU_1_3]